MAKTTTVRQRSTRSPRSGRSTPAGEGETPRPARAPRRAAKPRLPNGVALALAAARDKKAEDLVVLDLRAAGGFTDYFLICTGANTRQIVAIADAIRDTLARELGERPTVAEGLDRAEWVLLDYFDFVVHVFSREYRAFYDLERLWGTAERVAANES